MEAKLKDKQAAEATVEITVPAAEVDQAFSRVLGQLSRQVKIPGFRPGKAPKGVLIKRIGQQALEEEVREALVEKSYPKALEQFELTPVHAHIHGGNPSEGEDFTFDLHIDLYPEVELPPLDEIVIDSDAEPLDDEMVASTVERLRTDHATLVPVERAAEPSDQLMVESVSDEDGEGAEASSAMPIDLDSVGEELARQLIGKKIGDVVELKLASPEAETPDAQTSDTDTAESEGAAEEAEEGADAPEASDEEEEGAAAAGDEGEAAEEASSSSPPSLRVRITDVKEKEKPEPDDEFAKTLGFENWAETEEQIRKSLQSQLEQQAFEEQRDEFVEKLLAATDFGLPNSLVQRRKSGLLENLQRDLQQRGMTLEQYVQQLDEKDGREAFERELQEAAEKAVRRDIVLERLLEQRGTRLSDAEFEASLRELAMQQGTDPESLRKDRGDEWLQNYRYLLTRDQALNEAVREVLAGKDGEAAGAGTESSAAAAEAGASDTAQEGTDTDEGGDTTAAAASDTAAAEEPAGEPQAQSAGESDTDGETPEPRTADDGGERP